jgi:uncharacterized protein (TIGR02246 family)
LEKLSLLYCQTQIDKGILEMIKTLCAALALMMGLSISPVLADKSLKTTIQDRETAWTAAFNAGDAAAVATFYEEDAVLAPPGMTPLHGRTAVEAALSGFMAVLKDIDLITDDVRSLGDNYAMEIGHSTYNALGEDGSLTPGSDNYIVVWHRGEDGVWRYVSDMFNARPLADGYPEAD